MNEDLRKQKNERISQTFMETKARRLKQVCKTYELGIPESSLNKKQKECLKMVFVESKWIYNYILNLSNDETSDIDIFKLNYKDLQHITHKDKDMNDIEVDISYLGSSMQSTVIAGIQNSIKGLSTLKKHGHKVGSLRFKSDYNSIDLKQYGITHTIVGKNRIKIQGIKKPVRILGLEQIYNFDGIIPEYSVAKLIKKVNKYYIHLTVFYDSEEFELAQQDIKRQKLEKKINKLNDTSISKDEKDKLLKQIQNIQVKTELLGIDFGCQTSFSMSNGQTQNLIIKESDRLKRLQRKLARQKKGSSNYYKTKLLIQTEYKKLINKKDNAANQLVAKLLNENKEIIIQDEQLAKWQKGNHGKAVQHGILGRVKDRLKQSNQVHIMSKWVPTTKLCTECYSLNKNIKLWDRIYICPICKCKEDRDIHAAKNMVWLYKNMKDKIGVDGSEFKREDFLVDLSKKHSLLSSKFSGKNDTRRC